MKITRSNTPTTRWLRRAKQAAGIEAGFSGHMTMRGLEMMIREFYTLGSDADAAGRIAGRLYKTTCGNWPGTSPAGFSLGRFLTGKARLVGKNDGTIVLKDVATDTEKSEAWVRYESNRDYENLKEVVGAVLDD